MDKDGNKIKADKEGTAKFSTWRAQTVRPQIVQPLCCKLWALQVTVDVGLGSVLCLVLFEELAAKWAVSHCDEVPGLPRQAGLHHSLLRTNCHNAPKHNSGSAARTVAPEADIYVNDAFGTAHRPHSSMLGEGQLPPPLHYRLEACFTMLGHRGTTKSLCQVTL